MHSEISMPMEKALNERRSGAPLDAVSKLLLSTDSARLQPNVGQRLVNEWNRTKRLEFSPLPNVVCREEWSVEHVTRANAFNGRVERAYEIVHVGDSTDPSFSTCVIPVELADKLRAALAGRAETR